MPDTISFFDESGYAAQYPQLDLLYEEDLFLGCYQYDINLPVKNENDTTLDIFEDTILHLSGKIPWTNDEMAERSCLAKDFVKALSISLKEKNYIKEGNVLTEKGERYLGLKTEGLANRYGSVLVLPYTKKLLPILLVENDPHIHQGYWDENRYAMEITNNSAGKAETIKGNGLRPKIKKNDTHRKIYPYEIRQLVEEYNCTQPEENYIVLAQHGTVAYSEEGHQVFLHLKCGIQQGLADQVIISDGQSVLSSILTQYIKEYYPGYLKKLQDRATQAQSGEGRRLLPLDKQKYGDIQEAWQHLKTIAEAVTPDEQRQRQDAIHDNVIQLHAIAERTLHNYLKIHPLPRNQYDVFSHQNAKKNERVLKRMALSLGLDSNDAETVLGKLDRYHLRRYQRRNVPELVCVLPLVIAISKLNDLTELRRLGRKRKFLLRDMERLDNSKTLRHGSESAKDMYHDYEQLLTTVKFMLRILLPDCRLSSIEADSFDIEETSQNRLNATVALRKALGWDFFERLDGNLKEDLLQVSPYYTGQLMPYPMDMVNILYRILENYLRSWASVMDESFETKTEMIEFIQRITGSVLPKALTSVNEGMVRAANADKPASLGAYTLVAFSRLPQEKLQQICESYDFFAVIGNIIELRGHANNTQLNLKMDEKEEAQLRDRVLECMKEMERF